MQLIHHRDTRDVEPVADTTTTDRVAEREDYRDTAVERRWDIAPGQIISLIAGVGFVVVGLIAVARAGLDTPLSVPVVTVLGFTHSAWLGLAEMAVGLLLMMAGLDPFARAGSAVLGALLVIAGVLIQAIPEDLPEQLALDQDMAVPLIVIGAVVALASMLLPVWRGRAIDRHVDIR